MRFSIVEEFFILNLMLDCLMLVVLYLVFLLTINSLYHKK